MVDRQILKKIFFTCAAATDVNFTNRGPNLEGDGAPPRGGRRERHGHRRPRAVLAHTRRYLGGDKQQQEQAGTGEISSEKRCSGPGPIRQACWLLLRERMRLVTCRKVSPASK